MEPVRAAAPITDTTLSTRVSGTATSTLTLGRKSMVYSEPRYSSVCPFWRPKPRTSVTVMPTTPSSVSASLTSSSLKGLMMASIFFMEPPCGGSGSGRAGPERPAVEHHVLPGRGVPGEILGHGVSHERAPEVLVPVDGHRPPHGIEQLLD